MVGTACAIIVLVAMAVGVGVKVQDSRMDRREEGLTKLSTLWSTTVDRKTDPNPISYGLTCFNAGNRTHTEELVKGWARAIIFELK